MTEASPNRSVMLVLAYLWPLAVVPLLINRDDAEVQWHAKHGIVLMLAELLGALAISVLTSIVTLITFPVGCVLSLFFIFVWVAVAGLHIAAIVKALGGSRLVIPGLSEYANRF
ncbi:MAG: hypothetical protein DMF89_18570 [Acidobacteria bacterium]|jgi:hypothetical protein|nr:MAG: hypothetical protein DMF90_10735 [Acidobacteriota bacterium]PYR47575.1 MAG: hypothetical protein DMF89_18570 [Acidobacteriota bacterium]